MSKFVIGVVIFLVLPVVADAAATPASRLLALEQTWMKAARNRDIPVLRCILGDDYVDINYEGTVRDRADVLRAPNVRLKHYTQKLSDEKVRIYGNAAVVTGRGVLEDAGHVDVAAWRFTDVFVRRDGTWKAVSSQETLERK